MNYIRPNIHSLLEDALSDDDLHILCQTHFPKVYNQFTSGQTKNQKIQLLLDFSIRQQQEENLLQQIEIINQAAYSKHAPYKGDAPSPAGYGIDSGKKDKSAVYSERALFKGDPPSSAVNGINSENKETSAVKEVILLIHGIRDQGEWQFIVRNVLQQIPQTEVIPVQFEYFDPLLFWCPFWTRNNPIDRVLGELRGAQEIYRGATISVIAHSFGTYVITEILKNDPTITLKRLILCGSVIPRAFKWSRYSKQVNCKIINDIGIWDVWPVVAQSTSWGYGASGTFGFGSAYVKDRYHGFGHSGFLKTEFASKYWLPWFIRNDLVDGEIPPTRNYLLSLLTVPFLQIKVLCFIAILTSLYYFDFLSAPKYLAHFFK
jgi:pimeloyl-ACP methyl ester carboxylesterase